MKELKMFKQLLEAMEQDLKSITWQDVVIGILFVGIVYLWIAGISFGWW